ncbi:hypothetical protein AgCh_039601 [Apium graveolens]
MSNDDGVCVLYVPGLDHVIKGFKVVPNIDVEPGPDSIAAKPKLCSDATKIPNLVVFSDKARRDVKPLVAKPIVNKKRTYSSNISQIDYSNSKGITPFMVADIETILISDDKGLEVQTPYAAGYQAEKPGQSPMCQSLAHPGPDAQLNWRGLAWSEKEGSGGIRISRYRGFQVCFCIFSLGKQQLISVSGIYSANLPT